MKLMKREITFEETDNPGNWSQFTFCPVFDKKGGRYLHHMMPSGTFPVPINPQTNKQEIGRCESFYNGWKLELCMTTYFLMTEA
jgi:hypothetical protein